MNAGSLAGPLFVVLGLLILRQRPRHAMGRLYLVVGVMLVAFAVTNSWLMEGLPPGPRLLVGWYASWAWAVPVILVCTFGLLLLPDGQLPSPRWRWVARASGLAALGFVLGMPYDGSVDVRLQDAMPEWGAPAAEVALLLGAGLALTMIPICVAAPFVRMRRGGRVVRRQLAPVAVAATLAVVLYVLEDVLQRLLPVDGDLTYAVAVCLVPIGVTVAVLRGGLFDIHRLVSRVVAYTIVVGILGAGYLGSVLVLGAVARGLTGRSSDLVVALSTLAVAALFGPLRRRVRDLVDRRFNRARYDARVAAEAFGTGLRDLEELPTVAADLERVVDETLQPVTVRLWVAGGTT